MSGPNRKGTKILVERYAYIGIGVGLLVGLTVYLWDRATDLVALGWLGPITQVGSPLLVIYAVGLIFLSIRRSVYARMLVVSATAIVISLGFFEVGLQVCDCTDLAKQLKLSEERRQLLLQLSVQKSDFITQQREQGVSIYPYCRRSAIMGHF